MDPEIFRRSFNPLRIAVLAISIAGCATAGGSEGTPPAEDPVAAKAHIVRIAIDATGHPDQDDVEVQREVAIVAWVAPLHSELTIEFKTENPFPKRVICPGGRFCASLLPPLASTVLKSYDYRVILKTSSGTIVVDPKLKVVS